MTDTRGPSRAKQLWWKVRRLWPTVYRSLNGFGHTGEWITAYDVIWPGRSWFRVVSAAEWDKLGKNTAQAYVRGHGDATAGKPVPDITRFYAERP